jgi:hypothetical protein
MIAITLKAKYHAYITALMPDRGTVEKINYLLQVRNSITDYNPDQLITVNVSEDLVRSMYLTIGSQQERLAAADNSEIKEALLPQLQANPDLFNAIVSITMENAAQTEELRTSGVNFLLSITKLQ